jgi:bifunctional DNA-binding transcriptional regulator/antitoxin component of YhaV-PrlF toxin-antitoxin module
LNVIVIRRNVFWAIISCKQYYVERSAARAEAHRAPNHVVCIPYIIIPVGKSLTLNKFKNRCLDTHMDVKELIEKTLGVKVESVEEVRGKSFPLFDMMAEIEGVKLALIKDPIFITINDEDVYEKKMEGNFVIVEKDGRYIVAKYSGEPNIEALRSQAAEKPEETEEENQMEEEIGEEDRKDYEEQRDESDGDPVKEIVAKLPTWADGAVIVKKNNEVIVLPIKRSTKKDGYYASVSWRPLDIQLDESLINHIITKNGKTFKANVYVGDKYINIFVGSRSSNRPRRYYSGRRR